MVPRHVKVLHTPSSSSHRLRSALPTVAQSLKFGPARQIDIAFCLNNGFFDTSTRVELSSKEPVDGDRKTERRILKLTKSGGE
ncbi:hypothetical protein E2P81_ATG03846 [Venturia nashicola]|nr:hypothetical protein E2P81_ATG03846 [Venturia nashicola]